MNSQLVRTACAALYKDAFQVGESVASASRLHSLKGSVYTAFDGDHFYFTDLFTSHAFRIGWMPINPEACLGYKQAVDALHTKRRVLAADVALLRIVDNLWIYTSQDAKAPAWSSFAEGVLVEALYWLSLGDSLPGRERPIFFVDLKSLASSGKAEPQRVDVTASVLRKILSHTHPEVIELVAAMLLPNAVPPVVTAAYHISDSKNAHWLREWMLAQGWATIIPTLAFPSESIRGLSDLAASWLFAASVSDMVIWLDPLDGAGRLSSFLPILRSHSREGGDIRGDWSMVGAPKAVKGKAWPITRAERDALPESQRDSEIERFMG